MDTTTIAQLSAADLNQELLTRGIAIADGLVPHDSLVTLVQQLVAGEQLAVQHRRPLTFRPTAHPPPVRCFSEVVMFACAQNRLHILFPFITPDSRAVVRYQVMDLATETWTQPELLLPLPSDGPDARLLFRHMPHGFLLPDRAMYLLVFTGGPNEPLSLFAFDFGEPEAPRWIRLAPRGLPPQPKEYFDACLHEGCLVVVGMPAATASGNRCEVHRLCLDSLEALAWEDLSATVEQGSGSAPTQSSGSSLVVDGHLLVFSPDRRLCKLNLGTFAWSHVEVSNYPNTPSNRFSPRRHAHLWQYHPGTKLLYGMRANQGCRLLTLDPRTGRWDEPLTLGKRPHGVTTEPSLCLSHDTSTLLVLGGQVKEVNHLLMLDLTTTTTTTINDAPSTQEPRRERQSKLLEKLYACTKSKDVDLQCSCGDTVPAHAAVLLTHSQAFCDPAVLASFDRPAVEAVVAFCYGQWDLPLFRRVHPGYNYGHLFAAAQSCNLPELQRLLMDELFEANRDDLDFVLILMEYLDLLPPEMASHFSSRSLALLSTRVVEISRLPRFIELCGKQSDLISRIFAAAKPCEQDSISAGPVRKKARLGDMTTSTTNPHSSSSRS